MGDKRNKKKSKAQSNENARTSSRLSKKKGNVAVSVEAEETVANLEEELVKQTGTISSTKKVRDFHEAPLSQLSQFPAIPTRRRQNTEKMDTIIAAELQTESDEDGGRRSIGKSSISYPSMAPAKTDQMWEAVHLPPLPNSESEPEPDKSKSKQKPKKKIEAKKKGSAINTIRFCIPCGDNLNSGIHVQVTESFEDVLRKVHECIGCQEVHKKPILGYKINGVKDAKNMKLDSAQKWQDLLEELLIIGKGKPDMTSVKISIDVPADYLEDLKYTLNKDKKAKRAKAGTKVTQKKQNTQRTNLNGSESNTDDGDNTDEDGNMTSKEKQAMEVLKKHLSSCELSSCHNSRCKIDKNGKHCEITWNKLRVWAQALATGKYGVTYKKPPNVPLFQNFYTSSDSVQKEEPKPINAPNNILGPNHYAFGIPGQYPPLWYPPTMVPYLPESEKRKDSPGTAITISSDDSDTTALYPFQTMDEFLTKAAQHMDAGDRDFDTFRTIFKNNGVQRVHELKKMSPEQLESTFQLNWGDAHFLHCRIKRSLRDTRALREGERVAKRQKIQ